MRITYENKTSTIDFFWNFIYKMLNPQPIQVLPFVDIFFFDNNTT